jgi:hypothetical protein
MLRNKLVGMLSAAGICLAALVTPALAGSLGAGIGIHGLFFETDGSETLYDSSVVTKRNNENGAGIAASAYLQYMFGESGFVIGIQQIPGSVTLGEGIKEGKIDVTDTTETQTTVTNIAKAKVENHFGAYIETPAFFNLFLKAGYSELDVITEENLGTGQSYGDATINAVSYGIGFRGTSESGIHVKLVAERTDYDQIVIKGTGADAANTGHTITADPESYGLTLSLGYQF